MIITHLDDGIKLEKFSKLIGAEIPKEKLEGFRTGLKAVLSMISRIEKGKK